ncbi:MAG: glycosyltransferase family 2 protein [Bacillota bacterium]
MAMILIASPIRQKPAILREFLRSLQELDLTGLTADFLLIDNNDDPLSSQLLQGFRREGSTYFYAQVPPNSTPYLCNTTTHHWNDELIKFVASLKNFILNFALEKEYTHVFLVDSDLILHPLTLRHLYLCEKDIVSEIFWTCWQPETPRLPQVWERGQYQLSPEFLRRLQVPGLYQVGGLGACTLISHRALTAGVNFNFIPNLDYWGEDRHFCIRAAVLGFPLYVDTQFPALHLYREADMARIEEYKKSYQPLWNFPRPGWQRKNSNNRVTLSMVVRNEANRYLARVLEQARQLVDTAVIIDDGSEDETPELCEKILQGIPLKLIRRSQSSFHNEIVLRQQQWLETIKTEPDWILALDADEVFEDRIYSEFSSLINQTEYDWIAFRLYDMWDEDHYREDEYWQAHLTYRPFLVRYIPSFPYVWQETALHCGRFPRNITELPGLASAIRIKHYGWARPVDRIAKYHRYLILDPEGKFGNIKQYQSILDPNPRLLKWLD